MSKITLPTVASGYNLSVINSNFQAIEDTLNGSVLFRDEDVSNEMSTDLDMNGNNIYNVNTIDSDSVSVGGIPLADHIASLAIGIDPQDVTLGRYTVTVSSNTTFVTLPETYGGSASSLIVSRNGVQQPSSHYSFNGVNITFSTSLVPGEVVDVIYFKSIISAVEGAEINDINGLTDALLAKQDLLQSGVNIKTINGTNILGSGNFTISDVVTDSSLVSYTPAGTGAVDTTVQAKLRESVSVKDFGAVGDGVTDDTVAVQKAINSGSSRIYFLGATYKVDMASLTLASNQILDGGGATLISTTTTRNTAMFVGRDKSNIKIHGFKFSTNNTGQVAALLLGCENVEVFGNTAINCGLVISGSSAQATDDLFGYYSIYASATSDKQSANIRVFNNICTGDNTSSSTNTSAVLVTFTYGAFVNNNTLDGYRHGVMWWGGDADPAIDGAIANQRKVNSLNISNNIITRMEMGDIWGSMGVSVIVSNNECDYSGDVGIDFEGCIDSIAIGNNVRNRTNGALTLGYVNKNVKFTGNVAQTDTSGVYIVNLFGTTGGTYDNQDLVFSDNEIRALGNTKALVSGPAQFTNLVIENNRLYNVSIDLSSTAFRGLSVDGNTFVLDWNHTTPFVAVGFQSFTDTGANSTVVIRRNKVLAKVAQTAPNVGVYAELGASFGSNKYLLSVEDNDFSAIARGWYITTTDTAANAENLKIVIKRNYIGTSVDPVLSLAPSGNAVAYRADNMYRPATGSDFGYPYNAPGAGKWFQGERSYIAVPLSAGHIGYVCTATGVPGTWKTYGSISA